MLASLRLEVTMGKKFQIDNLPPSADEEFLRETFSEYGTVQAAIVPVDKETGQSKGYALIEMASEEEAEEVIGIFHGARCDGRELKISQAHV